jgi:ribonuclease H / adenosylcobalamin/alpha-ribazole phosphatase
VTGTLLLVRHGATAHTAQGRFSGSTGADPVLSEAGEDQAARLGARLRTRPGLAAVVTSPIARAHRTAAVVAEACGLPLRVDAGLREIDFGRWEGRTGAEVARDWPDELAAWRGGRDIRVPGGETVAEVADRVAAARSAAVRAHPGATVVLVSHLYPVRLSVLQALGAAPAAVQRMVLEPTALTEIRVGPDGAALLVRYNDVAHLGQSG